ncbi:hypothetical protein OROMI_027897 [Orobanche minor]
MDRIASITGVLSGQRRLKLCVSWRLLVCCPTSIFSVRGVIGRPMRFSLVHHQVFQVFPPVRGFQELSSQRTVDHLKPQHYPIRDIKFNRLSTSGIFGCLSEDTVQLFIAKTM